MNIDDDFEKDRKALDELFARTQLYRTSKKYVELLRFISRFKRYSPFNAALVHMQMPGATYVLRAIDWSRRYQREVLPNARPLVALQPMGPVMFLSDVSDTDGPPLPDGIPDPFKTKGIIEDQLEKTLENSKRDGIRVYDMQGGSQHAGSIRLARQTDLSKKLQFRDELVDVRYELLINTKLSREAQYSTLVHELAHLYCGHLGTPNKKWWPDRRQLDRSAREFEAESAAYLICARQNLKTTSDEYLSGYTRENECIPDFSFDRVIAVTREIEQMGVKYLKPRK